MRWKAHFFLKKHDSDTRSEDFRFKSKGTPPQCKDMEAIGEEFLDMKPNIKFRSIKYIFQKKLKEDIAKIKQSPNIFFLRRQSK